MRKKSELVKGLETLYEDTKNRVKEWEKVSEFCYTKKNWDWGAHPVLNFVCVYTRDANKELESMQNASMVLERRKIWTLRVADCLQMVRLGLQKIEYNDRDDQISKQ